jgi:subtilisin-like proprotein convertase family protein
LITDINIRLVGLSHTYPDDLDIVLEHEPSGITVLIMSDACGADDLNNATILFDDESPDGLLPDFGCSSASGVFYHRQPTNYGAGDSLPAPAPTSGYGSTLSVFDGITPNGWWRLWVFDDLSPDSGTLSEWRLEITARLVGDRHPRHRHGHRLCQPESVQHQCQRADGLITDVNVTVSRLSHTRPSDIDMLLVSPDGDSVILMADACSSDDIRSINLTFDQQAANTLPASNCSAGRSDRPAGRSAAARPRRRVPTGRRSTTSTARTPTGRGASTSTTMAAATPASSSTGSS